MTDLQFFAFIALPLIVSAGAWIATLAAEHFHKRHHHLPPGE